MDFTVDFSTDFCVFVFYFVKFFGGEIVKETKGKEFLIFVAYGLSLFDTFTNKSLNNSSQVCEDKSFMQQCFIELKMMLGKKKI